MTDLIRPPNCVRLSTADRAAGQNREYVRRLLKKKQPGFSAVLDQVVWELTYTCDAPSAESPAAVVLELTCAFRGDPVGAFARVAGATSWR